MYVCHHTRVVMRWHHAVNWPLTLRYVLVRLSPTSFLSLTFPYLVTAICAHVWPGKFEYSIRRQSKLSFIVHTHELCAVELPHMYHDRVWPTLTANSDGSSIIKAWYYFAARNESNMLIDWTFDWFRNQWGGIKNALHEGTGSHWTAARDFSLATKFDAGPFGSGSRPMACCVQIV